MKLLFNAAIVHLAGVLSLATPVVCAAASLTPCDVTGAIGPSARGAESLPAFDVERNCASAFASREAAGECIAREHAARTKMESGWPSLSEAVKRICVARVPKGTARAYFALADCALKEGRLDRFRSTEAAR